MKKFLAFLGAVVCLMSSACNDASSPLPITRDYFIVRFHTCTTYETNVISDQHLYEGDLVEEPLIYLPKDSDAKIKANGWYTSADYEEKWDFLTDTVTGDLDLYAKWADIHNIFYYLQGQTTPIWTVSDACVGDPLELHDELCDGYEFGGYFEDPECNIEFDLTKPLYEDTTVYMKRNDIINLNPSAIKRRFVPVAAGGTGSKAGTIDSPSYDEFGNNYVDVNFGYSKSADPYIEIKNPVLDISKSQKLIFTFKNLGNANSFSLYWVSKFSNGTYGGGLSYYSADNHIQMPLSASERMMNPNDDKWLVKEVDVSSITKDGISTWGNSVELIKLRIQFGYVSTSITDLSNVIRFKSIVGIPDESSVGIKDSDAIKQLCKDDNPVDIKQKADEQSYITRGIIFPKNNNLLDDDSNTTYFKQNGVLLYCEYGSALNKYTFKAFDEINAEDYSYLRIKLSNYSYIYSLDISIKTGTKNPDGSISNSKNTSSTVNITPRSNKSTDYFINLFEQTNFVGSVISITLKFSYVGVDNAMLVHEIEFLKSRSFQVPGLNLNDNDCAGFKKVEGENALTIERDKKIKGSKFTSDGEAAAISKIDYDFDSSLYSTLTMRFYYPSLIADQRMTTVTLQINLKNGDSTDYVFDNLVPSSKIETITLPYNDGGEVDSYRVTFNDKCSITILRFTFGFNDEIEGIIDYSDNAVINDMLSDWRDGLTYDNSLTAGFISSTKLIRYYYGNRYQINLRKTGNVCLKNKKRVYLIYQGNGWDEGDFINIILIGLKSTSTSEYRTAVGNDRLLDSRIYLKNCRTSDSWNIAYADLDPQFDSSLWYVSQSSLTFAGAKAASNSIHIRGLIIK